MAGSAEERILAGEMLLVMTLETIDALSGAQSGKVKLPDPSRYLATVADFMSLAAVCLFGPGPAKVAARFGGVVSLAILLAPTKAKDGTLTGDPIALSAIRYLGQLTGGGVLGGKPATPTTAAVSPTGVAGTVEGAAIAGADNAAAAQNPNPNGQPPTVGQGNKAA